MPRKAIASRENVRSACGSLQAKGIFPTQAAVLREIGGGSMSTINKYLREWVEEQEEKNLPWVEIPEAVHTQFHQTYRQAYVQAIKDVESDTIRAQDEQREQMRLELEKVLAKVEKLEEENMSYQQLKSEVEALKREVGAMKSAHDSILNRALEFSSQVKELEKENTQLKQQIKNK